MLDTSLAPCIARLSAATILTTHENSPIPEEGLFMMTSSNGNIFRVTGPLCGEFTGPGEFPAQRPVTRSFDVFFDLRPNKRLNKQPWVWWFETSSWSLWRQCNVSLCTSSVLINDRKCLSLAGRQAIIKTDDTFSPITPQATEKKSKLTNHLWRHCPQDFCLWFICHLFWWGLS